MNPNMTRHHMAQLLQSVMHHLPMDMRHKVMAEVPMAYNDYYGRDILSTEVSSVGNSVTRVEFAR